MKNLSFIFILFVSIILFSCSKKDPNQNIEEGSVENNFYTSEEIGWTIEIPKGWNVVDLNKQKKNNEKGLKMIEESMGSPINATGLKHLINFDKNNFNSFNSTSEPFIEEYEGEWEENNSFIKDIIYETFTNQGVKVEVSEIRTEIIDGLEFKVFTNKLFSPKDEVILTQLMYSRLINGYDFGVNINYNNEKDRDEMLRVFKASKFKIRN